MEVRTPISIRSARRQEASKASANAAIEAGHEAAFSALAKTEDYSTAPSASPATLEHDAEKPRETYIDRLRGFKASKRNLGDQAPLSARSGRTSQRIITKLDRKDAKRSSRSAGDKNERLKLTNAVDFMRRYVQGREPRHLESLRTMLHELELMPDTRDLLRQTDFMKNNGISRIWKDETIANLFPADIRADAQALHARWEKGNFDNDPMRGLDSRQHSTIGAKTGDAAKQDATSTKLRHDYQFKVSPRFMGQGDLVVGQWWPMQVCAWRDGAHGSTEAGIAGEQVDGARSIVLSGGGYADKDEGNHIYYTGTEAPEGATKPTSNTQLMIQAMNKRTPVRVLRSSKLPATNPYRPQVGMRYDGLYKVVGDELLDEAKYHHRFHLVREPNQDPIRYRGPEVRPTMQEVNWFKENASLLKDAKIAAKSAEVKAARKARVDAANAEREAARRKSTEETLESKESEATIKKEDFSDDVMMQDVDDDEDFGNFGL